MELLRRHFLHRSMIKSEFSIMANFILEYNLLFTTSDQLLLGPCMQVRACVYKCTYMSCMCVFLRVQVGVCVRFYVCNRLCMYVSYCNFPMSPPVRRIGWSICLNFLNGWEVTLSCSYRSTCLSQFVSLREGSAQVRKGRF